MSRLVYSRTKKVRKSYTVDERIISAYVELYGITRHEAANMYKSLLFRTQMKAVDKGLALS